MWAVLGLHYWHCTPLENVEGCLLEILKRNPKWYQDPVFWVWLEMVLLKQHIISALVNPVPCGQCLACTTGTVPH